MKNLLTHTLLLMLTMTAVATTASPPDASAPAPAAAAAQPAERLPVTVFGQPPLVQHARISPDGTHWAGLFGNNGSKMVVIFNLFDKTENRAHFTLPDGVEARWLHWVNSENVLIGVVTLQEVLHRDMYVTRTVAVNRTTGKVNNLLWDLEGQLAGEVVWWPHDNSNAVLIAAQNSIYAEDDFWPAVYRVDVTTGRFSIIVPPHSGVTDWAADNTGTVRVGVGYNDLNRTSRLLYRSGGGNDSFRVVDHADARKRESLALPFLFLPGGDHALVVHDNERGLPGIYETDLATQTDVRKIYEASAGEIDTAITSADGTTLLGVNESSLHSGTHWLDKKMANLQAELDKSLPDSRVEIISMSSDQTAMLVHVSDAGMPGAIYYFSLKEGILRRLAYINQELGSRHLAPMQAISYKARDGLDIEAILTLPVGRAPHKLPFIVLPHGGPWAQDGLGYDYWVQFLVNRGYGVLQPNFRGSTGYGTGFTRKGEGQLGLAMQDDVTDAVKWAVAQGLADTSRVCIVGGSYGGYAAMWGIAKDPEQYRCAISISGVSMLRREVNDFAKTLNGNESTDAWNRMTPDFDAVSPINAVDRIKTPLLLIHGKKDITVDQIQSVKMYDRMSKAGKTVEFVSIPLADHYYTRQEDRVALLTAMENFLAKYNPAD